MDIKEFIRTWGPALLAVLLIRTFIFEPFRIPSGSMVPTLLIGDHVLVTKFSYGVWVPFTDIEALDVGDPERGDIIVFRYPEQPSINYIKRVVAIPGDRIRVRNNRILINDVEQDWEPQGPYTFADSQCRTSPTEHYTEDLGGVRHDVLVNTGYARPSAFHDEITIPEGRVFVMGDNRDNSRDSRAWGFVRFDQIKGKAHFVWLSIDSCETGGRLNFRLRTERFLHWLYE